MKSKISEVKMSLNEIHCRLKLQKEIPLILKTQQQKWLVISIVRKKKLKENKQNLKDYQKYIKQLKICVLRVPKERERERDQRMTKTTPIIAIGNNSKLSQHM